MRLNIPLFEVLSTEGNNCPDTWQTYTVTITPCATYGNHVTKRTQSVYAPNSNEVAKYCKWLNKISDCKDSRKLQCVRIHTVGTTN